MIRLTALLLLLLAGPLNARTTVDYLPQDADPDPQIPAPESVLGWDVGDWHVSHDKLVAYMRALANASPRVSLKVIGYTYEQRPLLQLAITSEANQGNLDALREAHLAGSGPLVVWMGYSVHGDEPSGSNASMLAAYYLAASRSPFVRELLDGTVVLIDPSINPDGLNRFASWANSNAGKQAVTDPATRQHRQDWPGGRTNHYLFDLNRDWLPLVHPSSRARVTEFHRWRPHVLTDHHEQGRFPGFFFQPGVPSRQNPLTPPQNLELTRALATYHAQALDAAGQPYFTEDAYDDFYYGKGSTYPDINGSIGILFEQRAIRGQALETSNGIETFRGAVANQLATSLSTLHGAWALRDRLKAYQAGFDKTMLERADERGIRAWVIGDGGDPGRAHALLDVLSLHGIEYDALSENLRVRKHEFVPGHAWVIPARQKQFGLLEAIMEQRTEFADDTFYDVSAWTLPLAYDLPFATVDRMPDSETPIDSSSGLPPTRDAKAWAVPWNQLAAPAWLQRLLDAGVKVRAADKPFTAQSTNGLGHFRAGTLVVQAGIQTPAGLDDALSILTEAAMAGLDVRSLPGTLTASGPDLGSPHFSIVEPIRPVIVGGRGTSPYDVGEQWFLLDQRLGLSTPVVDAWRLKELDLGAYTHLLMADGDYQTLDAAARTAVTAWVRAGGILVTTAGGAIWAEGLCFTDRPCDAPPADSTESGPVASRPYGDYANDRAQQVIGGAIVSGVLDLTHPLAFGYEDPELPLFRRGTVELTPSDNAYATPVRYGPEPLMAGFIGGQRLEAIRGKPAVIAERQGDGLVVRFANTPVFRGFWRGTEKLFINALYFGQVVEPTTMPANGD
ncbi:MAG: M14 family zinc carboxypeptidase [Lysobacterales bacterium]